MVEYEWDEKKNEVNIIKHGFDFARASTIFDGLTLDCEDTRKNYSEKRTISLGMMNKVVVVSVVHTDRNGSKRIISARIANKKERRMYEAYQTEIGRRTSGNE